MVDPMVGCSLRDREASDRIAAWSALIRESLIGRELRAGGFSLRFAVREGIEDELRRLAEMERQCCGTLSFEVRAEVGSVTMSVDGPWKETPWSMAMAA